MNDRALRGGRGWTVILAALLAIILVPFFIYGEALDAYSARLMADQRSRTAIAIAAIVLLAGDVLLPIPSSLLSTLAGRALGFSLGTLASATGMTAACIIGYAIGRYMGRPAAIRLVGPESLEEAERVSDRFGLAAIAVLRPVPVVAEASVILAGATRVPIPGFLAATILSNVAISAVYAAVGQQAGAMSGSFLIAFIAAMIVPGIAILLTRALRRR